MTVRNALMSVALIALGACSGANAEKAIPAAQAALDAGDTARALELTAAALPDARAAQDGLTTWRLESIALLALAEEGRAEEAIAAVERLAQPFPKKVNSMLYARLANRAAKADHLMAAIDLAEAGMQRYPARKPDFDAVIADMEERAEDNSPALERLEQLGYVSKTR